VSLGHRPLTPRPADASVYATSHNKRGLVDLPTYSIVIPVHNEDAILPVLKDRIVQVLTRLDGPAEVILVDDGSTDRSYDMMLDLNRADPRFKVVHLSRNFGHQLAITAGIDLAEGQAIVVMDADLQDPPELILDMAAKWREGYEIVFGVRADRSTDGWFKRTTAALFYRALRRVTEIDIPENVGDFRLIDRRAAEAFKGMREGSRFVRGMFGWMGFRQTGIPYKRAERMAGETKYPVKKMMKLAADGMVGFSRVPLRIALNVGFLFSFVALLAGSAAIVFRFTGVYTVPGWASVVFVVCLLGGLQLGVMGMMGEYIGRTYEETIRRPLYIVSDLHGVRAPLDSTPRGIIAQPRTVATTLGNPILDGTEAIDQARRSL
jgi:glycosyltransferase involved in cell wall biosynthesis